MPKWKGRDRLSVGSSRMLALGLACLFIPPTLIASCESRKVLKSDEVVTFFETYGRRSPDRAAWIVNIHGWVHKQEERGGGRDVGLRQFQKALGFGSNEAATELLKARARPFLVENKGERKISVRVGGAEFPVGETAENGHVVGTITLPVEGVAGLAQVRGFTNGWVPIRAVTRRDDRRDFLGAAQLIEETGISVISDIDDTIKITEVLNRKELLANTFLREFRPVPGMAEAYQRWARAGAVFHYVSASPWQLYGPLSEFLRKNGFPAGTLHMKLFRWKDSSFFDLFASPEQSKPRDIEPILTAFPRRRFVLVGDSGEKDPEIYGEIARHRPDQVAAVFIRDVTGERADSARYAQAFAGVPRDRWRMFLAADDLGPISP